MRPSSFPSEFPSQFPSSFPSSFPSTLPSSLPSTLPSTSFPSEAPTEECVTGNEAAAKTFCESTVPFQCCTESDSCTDWNGNEHTICKGSCVGTKACNGWASGPGQNTILPGSCVGTQACYNWNGYSHTIGPNSCAHLPGVSSCENVGGDIVIKETSCNADRACINFGRDLGIDTSGGSVLEIGVGSCNNYRACWDVGIFLTSGKATIGDNACTNGNDACLGLAGWDTDGEVTVEKDSCLGALACRDLCQPFYCIFDTLTVETGACVGTNVCFGCHNPSNTGPGCDFANILVTATYTCPFNADCPV